MMKTIKLLTSTFVIVLFFLINPFILYAQVAINTDNSMPDSSAMLDVKSTSKGILIPRLTTAQRNNIASAQTALLVYDTDLMSFMYYDGNGWLQLNAVLEGGELGMPVIIIDLHGKIIGKRKNINYYTNTLL